MSQLENLWRLHGPATQCTPATEDVIRKYENVLPAVLVDEWREHGWCSYADGGLWFVNPDDFASTVEQWLPDWCEGPEGPPIVFARGAFGDLLISHEGIVGQLNVHYGRYVEIGDDVDMFLEYALDKRYVSDALEGRLARRVRKELGVLDADEIYTFVPALAMGGTPSASSARKVKMLPQLSILSQLFDEISIE